MKKERIGLFGGTFNPIHLGHLKAAEIVQKRFLLDKILFIPSYIPPHKETVEIASPLHRLKMVDIACASYPLFIPSSIEIEAKGKSYSIITLSKVEKIFPEALIFFLLGVDSFLEIETWREHEKLLAKCFFIIVNRPGYHLKDVKEVLNGRYRERMHELSERGEIDEGIFASFNIFLFPIQALNIASTEIRRRIQRGDSVKRMVTAAVEAYIKKNKLYQN
ncbi:MAG: nicotinate-nucleotide adenylyltransferase [Candidatus Aminicenantaceae bacterium]